MHTMPHLEKLADLEKLVGESQVSNTNLYLLSHLTRKIDYFILIFVIHFRLIRHYMTICTRAVYRMAGKVLKNLPYSEAILKSRQGADSGSGGVHGKLRTCQDRVVQA